MYKIEAIERSLQILRDATAQVEQLMADHLANNPADEKVLAIIDTVAEHFNISKSEIKSGSRVGNVPDAKKIISHELFTRANLKDREIADLLSCDRSTISNARAKFDDLIDYDKRFTRHYNSISKALESAIS